MGVAAAHDHRIGLAGQADIVGVLPLAAHQDRVLGARHRLADAEFLGLRSAVVLDPAMFGFGLLASIAGSRNQPHLRKRWPEAGARSGLR